MPSNYKRLGDYIQEVNIRNRDLSTIPLLGVSIKKVLMPSIANIIGTDMSTYKLIKKNQFAYGPVTSRNGDKISIALLEENDNAMVSQAYTVFEVIDENELLPEYLMMWFRRPEFDRYARFMSHGSAREIFSWTEMCETLLPIPTIEKQQEIVREYNIIQNRIALNNQLISKLEETAQAIYKQWFVDFEFPAENGKSYKSNGGKMVWCAELEKEVPEGWEYINLNSKIIYRYGKNLPTDKLLEFGYEVYGGNGVIGYFNQYIYDNPQVMISCRGAASGKIIISKGKSFITNNSIIFEYQDDFIFPFLKEFSIYSSFENFVTGSAQPQITIESLNDLKILWPNSDCLKNFSYSIYKIFHHSLYIISESQKLKELKELLLAKMTRVN
jgi:type I restriction enzyme S subunit